VSPSAFDYWVRVNGSAGSNSVVIPQSITTGNFSTLFGLLAVELAVTIHSDGLRWGLAALFFAIALFFVYRSFYGMRIHSGADDETSATSHDSHGASRSNNGPRKQVADPVYK